MVKRLLWCCAAVMIVTTIAPTALAQAMPHKKGKRASALYMEFDDSTSWRVYAPVEGFFQKAHTDLSSNRFVLIGKEGNIVMGIGGRVSLNALFDFGGTIPSNDFITSMIPVPTNYDNQFRIFANSSRINFKVIANINNRPLVTFIEGGFTGTGNAFKLRHAYISYRGFTLGQTWSTFMDLEAMPLTVDGEGPSNAISVRQPMIRYTHHFKKIELAVAAEMATTHIADYTSTVLKVYPKAQRIPNFTAHVKYKGNFGHVQVGGVLKVMNYGDSTSMSPRNVYVTGGGVSLSGIFRIGGRSQFIYQATVGRGISNYIQDMSGSNYDLVPPANSDDKMGATLMYGWYAALAHNWTPKVHSNVVYGMTSIRSPYPPGKLAEVYLNALYKSAYYFAVNVFWDFVPNGTVGVEYLRGQRENLNGAYGEANRMNLVVSYMF